jgi:hypothetical protein
VILQILLDDKSAHGMTDQNRWTRQLLDGIFNVFHEIGNSSPAQFFSSLTFAVSAQVDGVSGLAVLSEVIQKMHLPARSGM